MGRVWTKSFGRLTVQDHRRMFVLASMLSDGAIVVVDGRWLRYRILTDDSTSVWIKL